MSTLCHESPLLASYIIYGNALVKFFALDTATHSNQIVDDFRLRQAEAITAHITQAHHPNLVCQLRGLADAIRRMPNQLFLQAFLTIKLVLEVIEDATLYFVQRQPPELGNIAWIIDQKNRTITKMEETWATLILPMSEFHFAKEPFKILRGADYSHFDARYGFTIETADEKMMRHLEWMQEIYSIPPLGENEKRLDAKLLLSDQREFRDSRDSLGLQLADMLATILRRALNNNLQLHGWKNFGRLLVRKSHPGSSFIQLGPADDSPRSLQGHAAKVCRALDARAKSMLTDGPA